MFERVRHLLAAAVVVGLVGGVAACQQRQEVDDEMGADTLLIEDEMDDEMGGGMDMGADTGMMGPDTGMMGPDTGMMHPDTAAM